jgi:DNA-binding Lrp family transcriptional regulator
MDEHSFKTLKELSNGNTLTQRDISKRFDVSIGKVNYIINALIKKGHIKSVRFKNSKNKIAWQNGVNFWTEQISKKIWLR